MIQSEGPGFSHPSHTEKASIQKALSEARGPAPNSPTDSRLVSGDPSTLICWFARYTASWGGDMGGNGSLGGGT